MKKVFLLILCTLMIFSSFASVYSEEYSLYSIDDAYADFKKEHPDFVSSLLLQNVSEELLVDFLYDVHSYILSIHSHTPVTEENFEKNALSAISSVSSIEKYYPVQDALLVLYPDAIRLAIKEGVVSKELVPIVETVKKIIFENGLLEYKESSPEQPAFTFSDLASTHWAYSAVMALSENFILNGYLDGTFRPEANITRGEFAKIIVSATESLDIEATVSFSDVKVENWYYFYVASAYKKGYITGYPDGTFRPDDYITRADICTIVSRCIGSPTAISGSQFKDDHLIASYAKIPVYALVRMGIINGMGDGNFAPSAYATRAQTAKIIFTTFFK